MTWLLVAIGLATGAAGLAIGAPAWQTWRSRAAQERNAERYLAWRGRGDHGDATAQRMTSDERRRIGLAAGLLAVAIACLVIGLST